MSQRFARSVRLRSRGEFVAVQQDGRRVSTRLLVLLGLPNSLHRDRFGIVASRKLGGAVTRNRTKRRLREAFRRQQPDAAATRGQQTHDFVVIPKRDLLTAPLPAIEADVRSAIRRLRVR